MSSSPPPKTLKVTASGTHRLYDAYKKVFDACEQAGIAPPHEVADFFDVYDIHERGCSEILGSVPLTGGDEPGWDRHECFTHIQRYSGRTPTGAIALIRVAAIPDWVQYLEVAVL